MMIRDVATEKGGTLSVKPPTFQHGHDKPSTLQLTWESSVFLLISVSKSLKHWGFLDLAAIKVRGQVEAIMDVDIIIHAMSLDGILSLT